MLLLLALLPVQDVEHTRDSLDTVKAALEKKAAVLLDVRESSEWDQGHLQAARLVSLSALRTASAEEVEKAVPKASVVYLHCRSGARALTAAKILRGFGYDARPLAQGFEELRRSGFTEAK
jgi:phage shock protein E